jgi:hypothetical protein
MKKKYSTIALRSFDIKMEEKIAANCTVTVIVNENSPPCVAINTIWEGSCTEGSILSGNS